MKPKKMRITWLLRCYGTNDNGVAHSRNKFLVHILGVKAIDAMIPIGRGQRELVIGDRQTSK